MIKMKDFYMLCKWENLQNRQCIKYLFSSHSPKGLLGTPFQFFINAII